MDAAIAQDLVGNFKQGMRRLASTICIVTTADSESWYGMTATAVCSVCVSPPSLLVSVAQSASLHAPTLLVKRICVNVLRTSHAELVGIFSGKLAGKARFEAGGDWKIDRHGLPFLADAQANFFCSVEQMLPHADHGIFVATVFDARYTPEVDPLLYQDGALARSTPLA